MIDQEAAKFAAGLLIGLMLGLLVMTLACYFR